ncbi:flagellar protein FlaG [Clostridium cibarium]|uniref:Flagellar protein FlaG n=1 Tax=Clostridium cibarium TaxID=2762247 RepID=A0ABR8PNV3_9CLOT|nr:flagellar protein FlaG [Clostridium cibarium]MBD7909858.1 flagellar protein FlaG [Clostridium cibarium]
MDIKVIGHGGQTNLNGEANSVEEFQGNKDVAMDKTQGDEKKIHDEEEVKDAVNKLNKFLQHDNTHAEYSVHKKFKTIMIKIIDDRTDEVVMEVPPEKILNMVAKMCELNGIVFDKTV